MVNWNRRDLLRACLESLRLQDGVDFETIVVDNGSTDGSPDVAREFGAAVIRNEANRGFCAANNQGIAAAGGEFVALLNNDAEADPGWLAALHRACSRAPEVGMAASKVLVWEDPRRIDKVGHLIFPDGQNRGRGAGAIGQRPVRSRGGGALAGWCAAMYRKSMLDRIGGFDEDFFAYGDDAELGLRARIAGWKCMYAPRCRSAPSPRFDAGKGIGVAAGIDRAQSGAAGPEAVPVEPAMAESGVLRSAGRGGRGDRRTWGG